MFAIDEPLEERDSEYEELAAVAGSLVVRWVWASLGASWEVPIPHFAELAGEAPRRAPLKKAPKNPQLGTHYGLDAADRIVVMRSYRSDGAGAYEKFISYAEGAVKTVMFDLQPWDDSEPPKAVAGAVTVTAGRKALEHVTVNRSGERVIYVPVWADDLLIAVEMTTRLGAGAGAFSERYEFRYTDADELLVIRNERDGTIIYRRPPADLAGTLERLNRGLAQAIVEAANANRPEGQVAVLALGFDGATILPPSLGLQTERDFLDSSRTPFERWNPGDMTVFVPAPHLGTDVEEAVAGIASHIACTEDSRLYRAVQSRLIRTLRERRWSDNLDLAPDFVVVGVDLDADDLSTEVRAGLPRAARERFMDLDLL